MTVRRTTRSAAAPPIRIGIGSGREEPARRSVIGRTAWAAAAAADMGSRTSRTGAWVDNAAAGRDGRTGTGDDTRATGGIVMRAAGGDPGGLEGAGGIVILAAG